MFQVALRAAFPIALALLALLPVDSQADDLLIGGEIELKPRSFARIVNHFDVKDLIQQADMEAQAALPIGLKEEILAGRASDLDRAKAVIQLLGADFRLKLKAKEPVPAFLDNMVWEFDKGREPAIEFKHKKPYKNRKAFEKSIYNFADKVGIRDLIDRTTNQFIHRDSFHYHISFPNQSSIAGKGRKLNLLHLLMILERGEEEVLSGSLFHYGYHSGSIENPYDAARGIYRGAPHPIDADPDFISDRNTSVHDLRRPLGQLNRAEIRKHVEALDQELDRLIGIYEMSDADAQRVLDQEIKKRLTPQMKQKIFELRPHALADFEEFIPANEMQSWLGKMRVQERIEALGRLKNWTRDDRLWLIKQLRNNDKSGSPDRAYSALRNEIRNRGFIRANPEALTRTELREILRAFEESAKPQFAKGVLNSFGGIEKHFDSIISIANSADNPMAAKGLSIFISGAEPDKIPFIQKVVEPTLFEAALAESLQTAISPAHERAIIEAVSKIEEPSEEVLYRLANYFGDDLTKNRPHTARLALEVLEQHEGRFDEVSHFTACLRARLPGL